MKHPPQKADSPPRRKRWPALALAVVGLLTVVFLTGEFRWKKGDPVADAAALQVKPNSVPSVVQVRAVTAAAREKNLAHTLSLNDEVLVDVRSAGMWLRDRIGELGKANLDPRAKVTLETVVYDPATESKEYAKLQGLRAEQKALEEERKLWAAPGKTVGNTTGGVPVLNPAQFQSQLVDWESRRTKLEQAADGLLLDRRNAAWREFVKATLESACLVVDGQVFCDLHPHLAYGWNEYYLNSLGENDYDHYDSLRFRAVLTEANKQQWKEILGGIGLGSKPVGVSLALLGMFEPGKAEIMPTAINPSYHVAEWQKVNLKASTDGLTTTLLALSFLLAGLFVYYAFYTNLLRDYLPDGLWHLSLGRCQMAFWFFVICGCYIFLWIILGDYRTLTPQELLLLGISATTGLGAYLMAETKEEPTARLPAADLLSAEELVLYKETPLVALIVAEKGKQKPGVLEGLALENSRLRLAELEARLKYYKRSWLPWLRRSLSDLICEQNDGKPSFHRFQMMGWTLVLGVVFLRTVYYTLAMPEFSNDQLLLIGISNGTYLGFKWSVTRSDQGGK